MQVDFQRTLLAIASDRKRAGIDHVIIGFLSLLFLAWSVWLFAARLPLFQISTSARVEVSQQGSPLEVATDGQVAKTDLKLGRAVRAGDVLVELDEEAVTWKIDGLKAEIEALSAQLTARRKRAELAERVLAEHGEQSRTAIEQARAKIDQAQAAARFSQQDADQSEQLYKKGIASKTSYRTAIRDTQQNLALARAAEIEVDRLKAQAAIDQSEAAVRFAELNSLVAELEAILAGKRAELETLRKERENHRIRAASNGILGEIADIRAGSYVEAGTRLATIVPDGELRIVAAFAPSAAFGRIVPGQPASVRLAGFPWEQYGTVPAHVVSVAREVRDNTVRVELGIEDGGNPLIPLQHGLPGEAEVTVAEISPWALIVRKAAEFIQPASRNDPPPAAS
ncbi:MAG: Membrane fusion component of tripartite multidrug resistance system [Rhizobiaceae bacterium]|nr:Membrane fusion component of tripartite multidrug resistance system [Rhizobiaceae bacterium]